MVTVLTFGAFRHSYYQETKAPITHKLLLKTPKQKSEIVNPRRDDTMAI